MPEPRPTPADVLACYPALCRAAHALFRRCAWVRAWYGEPADVAQAAAYYALRYGLAHAPRPGVPLADHLRLEGVRHACQEAREKVRGEASRPRPLTLYAAALPEPASRGDPSAAVLARLDVAAALGVLTPPERVALERRYGLAGHPPSTEAGVAEALGLSPGGVARTLHDARARLRRHFKVGG